MQAYPQGSGLEQPVRPDGPAPPSVVTAVRLMYAGAVLSAIEVIISLVLVSNVRKALRNAYPHYSSTRIHTLEIADIVGVVVIGLIGIALWLLMARLNAAGRGWARIVATVLFGIDTLLLLASFRRLHTGLGIGIIFDLIGWLIGLGAVIFLWRRESTAYFQQPLS
jgi:hypothetical protein